MIGSVVYLRAIERIIAEGYTVLQIIGADGDSAFFVVYKWQEGYFNTAQSVDFNTVEGVDITDFMKKNAANAANPVTFMAVLRKTLEDGMVLRCEFTKSAIWYKWGAVSVPQRL